MKEMVRKSLVAFLAMLLLSGVATQIQAQQEDYRGTYRSVRLLILRIENRADLFVNSVNDQNQSSLHSSGGENLDGMLQDLKTAFTRLRVRFERRAASATDVQDVFNRAAQIDLSIRQRVRGSSLRKWINLRTDLKQLASAFNLSWPTISQTNRYNDPAPMPRII